MRITLFCNDSEHPINARLQDWATAQNGKHTIRIANRLADLGEGELLFLVSCSEFVPSSVRSRYTATLVLHASDLPRGRGWSPHIWDLLDGKNEITVTLLHAANKIDTGDIVKKQTCIIPSSALWDEINERLFETELTLIEYAITNFTSLTATPQDCSSGSSYYAQRHPKDSELDPSRSLAELFNQMRVCDPQRYPAFFTLHGTRYKLTVEKLG